jgi:hypothetical protein
MKFSERYAKQKQTQNTTTITNTTAKSSESKPAGSFSERYKKGLVANKTDFTLSEQDKQSAMQNRLTADKSTLDARDVNEIKKYKETTTQERLNADKSTLDARDVNEIKKYSSTTSKANRKSPLDMSNEIQSGLKTITKNDKAEQTKKKVTEAVVENELKNLDEKYKDKNVIAKAYSPEYQADIKDLAEWAGQGEKPANKMYNPESTTKVIPYLGEKAKMGLMDFAAGLTNLQNVGNTDSLQKNLTPSQSVQYRTDLDKAEFQKAEEQNTSPALKTVGNVVQATTAMIPNLILSAANPAMGLAQVGISAAGNSAQQAMKENATKGQALAYGGLSGGIEAGTEAMFGALPFMKGVGDKATSKLINPIKNKIIRNGVKWVANMGEEGLEEGVSAVLDPYAKRLTYDKNAKLATPAEIGEQMLMGAAVAGILGIPGTVIDSTGKSVSTVQSIKDVSDDNITFTMADGSTLELNPKEMDKADLQKLDDSISESAVSSETVQKVKEVIENSLGDNTSALSNNANVLDNTQNQVQNNNGGDINGRTERTAEADIAGEPNGVRSNANQSVEAGRVLRRADSGISGNVVNRYRLDDNTSQVLNTKSIDTFDIDEISDSKEFQDAINKAKSAHSHGAFVTVHSIEEYDQMKKFLSADKDAGVAVTQDGDIVSVFKNPTAKKKKAISELLLTALENGGKKLDNYNGELSMFYEQHGFVPVSKVKFDASYVDKNWSHGDPDVVFWIHNGDSPATVANKIGTYSHNKISDVPEFNSYEEAAAYRDKILDEQPAQPVETKAATQNVTSQPTETVAKNGVQESKAEPTLKMDNRSVRNVGNRNVKSYMFENPEVKDLYQGAAKYILDYEFVPNEQLDRITPIMKQLKADTGLTPAQVKDALERLVNNHGQENVAAAKRVELVIDDMLSNGFDMFDGEHIDANTDYLKLKSAIEGREIKAPVKTGGEEFYDTFAKQDKSNIAKPYEPNVKEQPTEVKSIREPKTEVEKAYVEQYTKEIPDDAEEVQRLISNLERQAETEKDESKLLLINLQLFAANKKLEAISKFKTNTLKKTPDLADDEMQKIIDEIDMSYGVATHKESIQKARDMVESDMQGTIDRITKNGLQGAEDTAAAYFIQKALKEEAIKTGDYAKLKKWLKTVQTSGTKHGQTIEAFKIWQEDPDGMLKNATKVVEDAENAIKKTDPNKIKQINDETKKVIDEVDKADKEAADGIADEVNKKADEIIRDRKKTSQEGKEGHTEGDKPKDDIPPEEMLAKKIVNYTKDPQVKKDDPVMMMVNELFKVAKESPIEREKIQSATPLEFVSEAIKNRKEYVNAWIKAKSIVRNKLADNPEALAKLEAYFDKGIRPPFSSKEFNRAVSEGMKELDLNMGEIVRNYYAIGSKSRKDLATYLVEKSGLEKQDAETLAKYVQNRMKELTKAKKEQILKNIFKEEKVSKPKEGALKSIEELSNAGAFVNDNYKDKVMEKLSPRLQRVINEKFKGTPTKKSGATNTDGRIDFGELVRRSTSEIDFTRVKFLKEISETLQINDTDAKTVLEAVETRFNEIVDEKRASILGNMFKKREATVKKTGIQRVQEYINKQVELENLGAQEDAIRDFIKEKYGLPTLTNDDMAFITSHIEQLKKLEEGTRPYNETLWRIYNRIESKVPSNFIDKFRAWQRISMLPNIKTFTRNILGNVFMEKVENFNELTTEALVDWITSAFTGKREILGPAAAIQKSIAQTKGKVQGLKDVVTDIKHGVNTYDVQGQYEINVSRNAFENPALNALEQFTNKTLSFGDRPFYEAAKARRLKELQIIKKTDTVTDEMEADAVLYALDRTFQNDSKLAKGVVKIKKAIDDPVYEAIANIIVPFAKTPANILDKISDYTPAGLVKAVGHLGKTAGKGTFDQKYFTQRLGRFLTGSGIIIFGCLLANKGIITGEPEKTTTKKGAFDKETGKQGYSLKTPNGYVAYDWAQPIGSLLAIGADAYYQGIDNGAILKGIEGAGNTFFDMSMLQSLNALMSYGNPMGGFITTMLGGTQQFTPTAVKQTAKIFDKYERDTKGDDYWENALNKFKSAIPGLRETLPKKTDTFGNPIIVQEGYGPLQKIYNIAANPASVTKSTMTDYEKEMDRLYNLDLGKGKKSDVLPSILDRTISDGKGTEYSLTPEQYNEYKKLYGDIAVKGLRDSKGNITRMGLEMVIRSKEYKELSDEQKAKKISRILSKAMDSAKDKMIKKLQD